MFKILLIFVIFSTKIENIKGFLGSGKMKIFEISKSEHWDQVHGWTICSGYESKVIFHGLYASNCPIYPCQVFVGDNLSIAVDFTPKKSTGTYLVQLYVVLMHFPIKVAEEKFAGPFDAGKRYRIEYPASVPDSHTGVFKMRGKVVGDEEDHACVELKVKVTDKDGKISSLFQLPAFFQTSTK